MPCKISSSPDGKITMIACSRGQTKCHICGKPMVALCDATKRDGTPCNAPMCEEHRHSVGDDTDVCIYHNKPDYIKQAIVNRQKRDN
jgi:hypothetical protein